MKKSKRKTHKQHIPKQYTGLGLCIDCLHISNLPSTSDITFEDYLGATCSKGNIPCCEYRTSLITCFDFEEKNKPKKIGIISKILNCLIHNSWEPMEKK